MKKTVLKATLNEIPRGVEFIRNTLLERKVSKREITSTLLTAEEALAKMIENCPDESQTIQLQVRAFLGNISIHMSAKGEKFELADLKGVYDFSEEEDAEIAVVKQNLINKILGDNISISSRRNVNVVDIKVKTSGYQQLIYTLSALVLGLLVGLIMKLCVPASVTDAISGNIFEVVSTMFLNSLKMIVGPLVFFSIASSIADFGDLKALGRMIGKVMGCYVFTSVLAIGVGYLVYHIIPIGDPSLVKAVDSAAASTVKMGEAEMVSIKDTIVNIIPSDYISPFLNADMLQVIFMAVLLGIGASQLSQREGALRRGIISANAVFSKITAIIISFMPVAIFCSMAKMVITMDMKSLVKVAAWIPECYLGLALMVVVYLLLLIVVGRLNPIKFLKGFYPAMLTAFTSGSSNATMPSSMKQCDEKLGIAKSIYSFSIPLGATVNMDGCCIMQIITVLFMAKIFGVSVTGSTLLTLIIAILALSIGTPGVPGSGLVSISILISQIGVPVEAISLIMGIYTFLDMGTTAANVTGDAVVTTLVAKSEKMIDLEKYNAN